MRTTEVFEAVTFPNASEILVRRRSARGDMKVLARIPRNTDTPAPLHEAMITALHHSRWQAVSPTFLLPGEEHGTAASGVKVEVASRYEHPADPDAAIVPLTEDHREALTDEAVRSYTQIDEPVDGLDDYSTAAAGSLIWDARLLPIRFTGHRDRCGDLVRAHTVADTGLWTPAADRATDLDNHALTARVLWQLIRELSD
ncbi:hypothetical protein [Rhodococcus artemisiae]|uniref:Uncharacterized protein n=1 Tax=Rhodococcus artemisiae TaxID=714159 RepID=A0ABU7LL79_9NOCA|nr:hypothetical protein [Rhodococcus artemisiae]MEE2062328.1 hypothetical protein [Rhodococcus artemisiae]